MASFVPPQVDHNLYTPILPQDNVQQIFSLLDQKQQMYNQGVKSAQHKISSMLSLEKDVTSDPVKNMVTDFNGKANDLIKQYANLDFSLQGNVSLIDNIYDPLLSNEVFLNDYSATRNFKNEMQKAYGYRDSTNDKTRNLFNQKNLDILNIKRQDLAGAQTEKDIKNYSARLANTSYTPYYDYNAELMGYMKDNKDMFEMVRDERSGDGVIISRKNGPQRYNSIKSFVDNFLSDKARNQIDIEESVNFANELRSSGVSKEQFLTQKIVGAKESLEQGIKTRQSDVNDVVSVLNSYPKKNLNKKQQAEVDQLNEELQKRTQLLDRSNETLSNFQNFMDKASNGEVELSRFYDVAENLVVSDNADKKIDNLARALVGPESLTIANDVSYWNGITENRLLKDLNHKIANDAVTNDIAGQKNLIEAAKEGLIDIYYDPVSKSFKPGVGVGKSGSEFYGDSTAPEGVVTSVNVDQVNKQLSEVDAKISENTFESSVKVLGAYAMSQNTPLNNEEMGTLRQVLKENNTNANMMAVINKYKGNKAIMDVLSKSGLSGSAAMTLGNAMKNIVSLAENYVKNTTKDQSGNKAGYYNAIKTTLDEHATSSVMLEIEKQLIKGAGKKTIAEFEKKYPEYKGLMFVDDDEELHKQATEINRQSFLFGQNYESKPSNHIMVNKAKEKELNQMVVNSYGTPGSLSGAYGPSAGGMGMAPIFVPKDFAGGVNALDKFNEFLKTDKGALGNVGRYMQKTIASNQGTFNWLKENKNLYINNPENYEVTMEQYEGSNYQKDASSAMDNKSTELEILNDIQNMFLQSIGDTRFNLPNKNVMIEGNKVIQRAGETIVYPSLRYLKYIYGFIDKEGQATDINKEGLLDNYTFEKMLSAVAKYGIKIKTPGSTNTTSLNLQAYFNDGNVLPISRSNAGSNAKFKIGKSTDGLAYALEGSFEADDDFFLQNNLTYKIDKQDPNNISLKPYDSAPGFNYYRYDLLPGQLDESLIPTANIAIDNQLYFNQRKSDNTFLENLSRYIKSRNSSEDYISGQLIFDYLNTITR